MFSKGFFCLVTSADRTSGTDTDFQFDCKVPTPSAGSDYNVMAVTKAVVPRSFWCITAPFNTFTLVENKVSIPVTVPEGNYATPAWCSKIATVLTQASRNGWTYNCVKGDNDTGLLVYTVSGNAGNQPSFIINQNGDLANQLGLAGDPQEKVSMTYDFKANQLTSTGVYSYLGDYAVNIYSDICEADGDRGLLATLFGAAVTNTQSVIVHEAQDHVLQWKRWTRTGSMNFRFRIASASNGQTLDTHGLPVSLCIKFMYDPADVTTDLLKLLVAELRLLRQAMQPADQKGLPLPQANPASVTPRIFDFAGLIRGPEEDAQVEPAATAEPVAVAPVPQAAEPLPTTPPEPVFEPAPVVGAGASSDHEWEEEE